MGAVGNTAVAGWAAARLHSGLRAQGAAALTDAWTQPPERRRGSPERRGTKP